MIEPPSADWSDERIVDHVREWAIERSKCARDDQACDRIEAEHLFPCRDILEERGPGSVAKLLRWLDDDNRHVRFVAASFAYAADPSACRSVLQEVMHTPDRLGVLAMVTLSVLDPSAPLRLPGSQ